MKQPTTFLLLRILYLVFTLAIIQAEGKDFKLATGNTTTEKFHDIKCGNYTFTEKDNSSYTNVLHCKKTIGKYDGIAGILVITENNGLAGNYTCTGTNETFDHWRLVINESDCKEKDPLAALWPFLGICAEVIVLCAIILIYEKKRNKAELDESDTDQSPDTKPTPNKDSDVRQRN